MEYENLDIELDLIHEFDIIDTVALARKELFNNYEKLIKEETDRVYSMCPRKPIEPENVFKMKNVIEDMLFEEISARY